MDFMLSLQTAFSNEWMSMLELLVPSLDKTDSFGSTSTSARLSELIRTRQNQLVLLQ